MTQEMTTEQKRGLRKQEGRNFRRFWIIYAGLFCTAGLSFIAGLMLPFMRNDIDVKLTWSTFFVAVYYGFGFLSNGELAANFWFGKLTDQDPDNTIQKWIAWGMLGVSVGVIAATVVSAADLIAWWVGTFESFYEIPAWVQKYVVYVIPVMWVGNVVFAMLFRGVSDEARAEREAAATENQALSEARIAQATARASYVAANAPALARQKGELEAAAELEILQAQIDDKKRKLGLSVNRAYNQDVRQPTYNDNVSDPTHRRN